MRFFRTARWLFHSILIAQFFATAVPAAEDCNRNGVDDEKDFAARTSSDCNQNGIPDECDLAPTHLGFKPAGRFRVTANAQEIIYDVVTGEFNDNRSADLVVLVRGIDDVGSRVSILLGGGDGGFGEPRVVHRGPGPTSPAVADLNGDGKEDLAIGVINNGSFLEVYLGNGDGTFKRLPARSLGGNAGVTVPADFDGDGDVDLVIFNESLDGILLLKNAGRATFQEVVVQAPTGFTQQFLLAGDFDGDRDVDLLALSGTPGRPVLHFRNRGDATFEEQPGRDDVLIRGSALAADFDSDGDLDVLASGDLLLNLGDGAFDSPLPAGLPLDSWGRVAADLDRDGDVDVIFPTSSPDPFTPGVIAIARNRGDGTFLPAERFPVETYSVPEAVADLDSDGIPDIVAHCRSPGSVHAFLGKGGTEPQSQDVNRNRVPDECELDCDRDGLPDAHAIAVGLVRDCNQNLIPDACDVLAGALFEKTECLALGAGGSALSMAVADLDDNGDLDLALLRGLGRDANPDPAIFETDTRLEVFLNDGSGLFAAVQEVDLGAFVGSLDAGDLDGDGKPEIIAVKSLGGSVIVFLNDGAGGFEAGGEYRSVQYARSVKAIDLDRDGLRDILVESQINETYKAAVLIHQGAMEFSRPRTFALRGFLEAVADLQGDGAPDLLSQDPGGSVWGSLNDGKGVFQAPRRLTEGKLLATADLDGDGDVDIAVDDQVQGELLSLLNRGDGTFERGAASSMRVALFGSAALDVDGDGDLDLAGAARGSLAVFLGDGKGAFSPPLIGPEAPSPIGRLSAGDFDRDGKSDLAVMGYGACLLEVRFNRTEVPRSKDANRDGIPDECAAAVAGQIPSDGNQDGRLDFSDAIWLIGRLFEGAAGPWPCADERVLGPGKEDVRLLDMNGDGALDISDPIALLLYLFFAESSPPALGTRCVPSAGCPDRCVS